MNAFALGLGPPAAVKDDPRFADDLVIGLAPVTHVLVFNTAHGATMNRDVRRAFSSATDRAKIARGVFGDASFAATTFTAPGVFGAVPPGAGVGLVYDEAAARRHKAAAGAAFPSSITLRYGGPPNNPSSHPLRTKIAAILEEDWERIFGPGFTVNVEAAPIDQLANQLTDPDASVQAPVSMIGWGADFPDAHNFLATGVQNFTRWTHTAYNALIARGEAGRTAAARSAAYMRAESILTSSEVPLAPMLTGADAFVHKPNLVVVGDRIENWSLTG